MAKKKNQIIIDGVVVSECDYLGETGSTQVGYCCINEDIPCNGIDCYYKQLQRALKENELLRHKRIACNKRMGDLILLLEHGIKCNND